MRFTSQEEYGLRCLLQLARHENKGPLPIEEISANEGITPHYVGKLMRVLLKGELVVSTRGQNGGYSLSKSANSITINEVLNVLDGRLFELKDCDKFSGHSEHCIHSTECSVRGLWSSLDRMITNVLEQTLLIDLIVSEKQILEKLKGSRETKLSIFNSTLR